jgi:fatty-acyl-CoA synthase
MQERGKLVMPGSTMDWQLNLYHLIERGIKYFPEQEAVFRTYANEIKRYTIADLYANACKFANVLKDKFGIKRGDVVTICGTNIIEVVESQLGILLAGAIVNNMNPRFSPDYVAEGMIRMQDKVSVIDKLVVPLFESMSEKIGFVKNFVVLPELVETKLEPAHSYKELISEASSEFDLEALFDVDEREAAFQQCTTGTTGEPKACLFSHRGLFLQCLGQAMTDAHGFSQYDTVLHIIPSYHGFWMYHLTALMLGMKQVFIGPNMDPEWVLRLIQDEKVTCAGGTPEVWGMILNYYDNQKEKGIKYDLSSFERVFLAGTAPPLSLQKKFEELGVKPMHVFGMTEMHGPYGTTSKLKPYMKLSKEESFEHLKRQGIPLPFVQVKGVDEFGEEIPWDGATVGELCLKGAAILREHYKMPEVSKELWTEDGWFRSGDLITIDSDGYMEIVDRKKDLVKSGGEFISTIALGAKILENPKVLEAAAVGVPHPKWGERPIALVVPKEEYRGKMTEEEIIEFLKPKVPKWWLPDKVLFVEELAKTSVGKIDKAALRKMYIDYLKSE